MTETLDAGLAYFLLVKVGPGVVGGLVGCMLAQSWLPKLAASLQDRRVRGLVRDSDDILGAMGVSDVGLARDGEGTLTLVATGPAGRVETSIWNWAGRSDVARGFSRVVAAASG